MSGTDKSSISGFIEVNSIFYNALNLSEKLKLRTLDLIRISYCLELNRNGYNIDNLYTMDKEFIGAKSILEDHKIN